MPAGIFTPEATMADLSLTDATGQLLALLGEAFEGAERWSYFTDHGADAGLLGTLAKLNAADASRPVGATSVAAHAHHVAFGLEASAAWVRGDRSRRNWADSWRVTAVDDAAWAALQQQLRDRYADLRRAVEQHAAAGVEAFGGAVGAVAHAAYHLGAIKQKVAAGRP
jgi:hypothetical protein